MIVSKDKLVEVVSEICPEMLSHEKFMHAAKCVFCEDKPNSIGIGALAHDEFEAWHKLSDKLRTATISQVLNYLKKNFKPDDKLCYMDCVEGVRNDCTYITRDQLGERFFYTVKSMKEREKKRYPIENDENLHELFPYVNDNDVVIG